MRKVFLSLGLALMTTWAMAQSLYQKNQTTNFYDYIGDPVTTDLVIDFSKITSDKVAYQSGSTTVHDETIIDFQQLGLFKYCYCPSRKCGEGDTYAPLLWNSGNSLVGGTSTQNKNISNNYDFPAIYLPKMKHGIQYIVVEGWGYNNPAALQYMKQLSDGSWTNLGSARILKKNAFTRDTFMVNDRKVQSIMMHRTTANNAYQFITKIIVKTYPAPQFVYNSTSKRYDYTGTPVEDTLLIDFSKLDAGLACYDTLPEGACHLDSLMGFENVGLYKWCYYASRKVGEITYAPILWNNGYSDVDGTRTTNGSATATLKPAVYLPTMKNGISKIIVEGWTNGNTGRPVMFIGKNASGAWKGLTEIDGSIASNDLTLQGNTYTTATIEINNRRITDVAFYRSSTEWQFITKVTVYPMPAVEPEYVLNNETGRYDYTGDTIEGVYEVNFNELTPYDVAYNTALGSDVFADTVIEFQHMGLYKYGYKDSRKVGDVTYAPLLWNNGKSDYSDEIKKNNELFNNNLYNKLPCLYFPTIKNGIKQVIIEGWSNNNARGINLIAKHSNGEWLKLDSVCPHVDKAAGIMGANTYTTLTFNINSNAVKNIGTWINCTDWQFITKVKIIPMGDNEMVIDEHMDNSAIIEQFDTQTVNLTVYRKLVGGMYNSLCLPCTVTVAKFKEAAGLTACELKFFSNATLEDGSVNLTFSDQTKIYPKNPYLIKPSSDVTGPIVLESVTIGKETQTYFRPSTQNWYAKFTPVYSPTTLNASENTLVVSSDNTLYYLGEDTPMPGLRAYFVLNSNLAQSQVPVRMMIDTPTQLQEEDASSSNGIRKMVINNQLIIEREGMKYNLQGERIQ